MTSHGPKSIRVLSDPFEIFVGGFLNQDADAMHGGYEGAIDAFLRQADVAELAGAVAALRAILAKGDEAHLKAAFIEAGGGYWPRRLKLGDGFADIAGRIDAELEARARGK